jgi:hypothetical protein
MFSPVTDVRYALACRCVTELSAVDTGFGYERHRQAKEPLAKLPFSPVLQKLGQNTDYCGFLFVLVRVISWIGLLRPTKERSTKSHELTLTKPHGTLEF